MLPHLWRSPPSRNAKRGLARALLPPALAESLFSGRRRHQNRFHQFADFFWIRFQVVQVVPHGTVVGYGHASANAPQDCRGLIRAKVNTGLAANLLKDAAKHILPLLLWLQQIHSRKEIVEKGANLFYFRFKINYRWGEGQWHGGIAGSLRVLDDYRSTRVLYLYRARCAVRA